MSSIRLNLHEIPPCGQFTSTACLSAKDSIEVSTKVVNSLKRVDSSETPKKPEINNHFRLVKDLLLLLTDWLQLAEHFLSIAPVTTLIVLCFLLLD